MKNFLFILFVVFSQFLFSQYPLHYNCYKSIDSVFIDGKINETSWEKAVWTDYFIDISGGKEKKPKYDTRVKMLWDSNYLYIAAELYEPHIWATLKDRDKIIYQDNDFEIFIDPDGDGELYYEIEINALNTILDLLMTKPYYKGGKYLLSTNITDLKSGIFIDGTINNPIDLDNKWIVEMAIPLNTLSETLYKKRIPKSGDIWRINFSRVNWDTKVENGTYIKINRPEYNWVWSPQGIIDMHRPERWGYLHFK